jgi:carboxymethylenebutenolidase
MGKTIQLKASDGHEFYAYVAEPAGKPRGLVVIAPEIFGINKHIQSVADGYAADGYLSIAPALFDRIQRKYDTGYSQPEIMAGVEVMKKMSFDHAMLDVAAVLKFGQSAGKAAIVGYCWGGVVAWLAASRVPGFSCSAPYYGGGIPNFLTEKPLCPVMFHFGETDQSIPMEKAKAVVAAYPNEQAFFYPADHGFNCDHRGSYNAESAKLARERTLGMIRKYVG